ncbi:neuronal acetylcholine receptor subunit alpha-7-like [Mizuhopecten yessoensis]|uniref:neuronal acetylcholine receptor subunit alpha-7-like n=1 Tax=Mizuhopecten yessoensis TaxID=6573 RepID=UPI000B458E2E|nr:neuronal acetylcholine receptor subunit alpha-7-like [Mizuhopecten yessoensis]
MGRESVTVGATVLILLLFGITSVIVPSNAYARNSHELYSKLFDNYTSILRPVQNENETVRVSVRFLLRGISEFDEVGGQLSMASAVDLRWRDQALGWNRSKYYPRALVLPESQIWTPRLALSNPTDRLLLFFEDSFPVRVNSDGSVIWLQGGTITSTCLPNVEKYPFDVHKCYLVILAIPYTRPEVQLYPVMDLSNFEKFGEWALGNASVKEQLFGGFFSSIVISLEIKRRPEFSLLSTILPILFLGVLNACVFLLPPEQGERVSYALTVLLSFAVFLSIISSVMPKNSEPVPILCYIVTAMMAMSGLSTLCTVICLRWFFADQRKTVPYLLQVLCRRCKRGRGHQNSGFNHDAVSPSQNQTLPSNRVEYETNVTWRDVSATFDMVFFVFYLVAIFVLVFIYLMLVLQ